MNEPFRKDGLKRLRRTRRDYGYGQKRMWGHSTTHFKREREALLAKLYYSTNADRENN